MAAAVYGRTLLLKIMIVCCLLTAISLMFIECPESRDFGRYACAMEYR